MKNHLFYFLLILCFYNCQDSKKALNVVVLYTDDQRFNTIQAWGNEEVHTPNMDRLAKMGMSFTHAHVMGSHHGAVCAPSRAMLLSGKPYFNIPRDYIDRGRANFSTNFDFMTFPEMFREQGYSTFFTGKWHNHTSKLRQGFENGKNVFIGGMHFPNVGGHKNPELWDFDSTGQYPKANKWQGDHFSSQMYSDAAVEFIENQPAENPFCLYVAYTSPHDPREAPEEYLTMYDTSKITLPINFMPEHPFDNGHLRIRDENLAPFPRTPEIIKTEIAAYYAMVSEVDAQIGRVLDALEAKNQLEHTVIVFAGDNGLAVGQHGLLGKQNLYEHSARVPLIIAAPNIKGNRKAETLCYIHDIFPTICDLTNSERPTSVEGLSLMPALQNEQTKIREKVFLSHAKQQRAVRTNDGWKLIRYFVNGTAHTQLYNVKNDPYEVQNLADNPEYASKQKELSEALSDHILNSNDNFLTPSIQINHEGFGKPVNVSISQPFPELELRYTLDGSTPNIESPIYENPFSVSERTTVKTQIFQKGKPINAIIESEVSPAQDLKFAALKNQPSKRYASNREFTLLDNQRGSLEYKDNKWLGFDGEDLEIVIQFKEERTISKVGFGYLKNYGAWIFPPSEVEVFASNHPNYKSILFENIEMDPSNKNAESLTFEKKIEPVKTQYLKIKISNIGQSPEWHEGAGKKAWLFVDEIMIE